MRTREVLTFFLFLSTVVPASASLVVCSSATGTSTVFTAVSCSPAFSSTAMLDWGTPVNGTLAGANSGGLGPAWTSVWPLAANSTIHASIDYVPFTITSNDLLERADNTQKAWSGSSWLPAPFVNPNNYYFAGSFGAPTTPTSQPQFGDDLLGALAPAGGNGAAEPTITLSFSKPLSAVAFQVSSAANSNFTADLLAFNSSGQQLGTYQVVDSGDGGTCAGLAQNPPQPCNTAPLIQFTSSAIDISSLELVMADDSSGVYIDELEVAPVPEPVTMLLGASGLLAVLARKRFR